MTNRASTPSATDSSEVSQPREAVLSLSSSFFARVYNILPDRLVLNSLTSVRQKIGWGYAIVIGVTLVGAAIGVGVDQLSRRRANAHTIEIATQQLQINRLQSQMLLVRAYTAELASVSPESEAFRDKLATLQEQLKTCLALFEQWQMTAQSSLANVTTQLPQTSKAQLDADRAGNAPIALPLPGLRSEDLAQDPSQVNIQALRSRGSEYAAAIQNYNRTLQPLLAPLTIDNLTVAERTQALNALVRFLDSSESQTFSQYAYELSEFSVQLSEINTWLTDNIERADRLSFTIWLASLCVAIAVTAGAIFYISGIISYPLVFATNMARRITQESNYRLQIPQLSNDEIGSLSEAINLLVQKVEADRQEIQEAQSHLIQAEKMSSLGQMVAGVAHEINNPVNFIYGNLAHLENSIQDAIDIIEHYQTSYPNPQPETVELLEELEFDYLRDDIPKQISSMRMGAERIRQIVLSLRTFSRLDEAPTKRACLHEGLDSTLTVLAHRLQSNLKVVKHYGKLPEIECRPAQLNQVWMNVLSNALDALDNVTERFDGALSSPKITIETLANNHSVTVKIRDNGVGIPEALVANIFDPFFTTKPIGKGTGLGLSICFAIIERHGGTMRVRSQLNLGTEFTFVLPISLTSTPMTAPLRHFERRTEVA